jgi:hypothetical protein
MTCWKWPCEPIEILSCCYIVRYADNWQYYRYDEFDKLRDMLPSEWRAKLEKFHNEFYRDDDIPLGYIVMHNNDGTICSIVALVLHGGFMTITVDFSDVDEWFKLVTSNS